MADTKQHKTRPSVTVPKGEAMPCLPPAHPPIGESRGGIEPDPRMGLPPPPRVPSLEERDTEPPSSPDSIHRTILSLAPEALTAALGRLTSAVELATRASEGARDAAIHTADALQAHIAGEREWQGGVDRRLASLDRASVALPVAAVVLGGISLLLALVALLVALGGHPLAVAAVAPPSLGAVVLGGLGALLGVGHG